MDTQTGEGTCPRSYRSKVMGLGFEPTALQPARPMNAYHTSELWTRIFCFCFHIFTQDPQEVHLNQGQFWIPRQVGIRDWTEGESDTCLPPRTTSLVHIPASTIILLPENKVHHKSKRYCCFEHQQPSIPQVFYFREVPVRSFWRLRNPQGGACFSMEEVTYGLESTYKLSVLQEAVFDAHSTFFPSPFP